MHEFERRERRRAGEGQSTRPQTSIRALQAVLELANTFADVIARAVLFKELKQSICCRGRSWFRGHCGWYLLMSEK